MRNPTLKQNWVFTLAFILSLSGCDLLDGNKEESIGEAPFEKLINPENELIPLAVGNYWIYDSWRNEPSWRDTIQKEIFYTRDIIVENTKVHAYGTTRFSFNQELGEDTLFTLVANGPEGYFSIGFDIPADSLHKLEEGLLYKYPAKPRNNWECFG